MTKAKHPGRTIAERRVLDEIGGGKRSPIMTKVTRSNLLRRGIIQRLGARSLKVGIGGLTMKIDEFEMTTAVHIQWCQWCSENVKEGEL